MVFLFFHLSHFFKNYTHAAFQFFVILFVAKKSIFNAKNENCENPESSENAENAENPHQNFDCYGVIQQSHLHRGFVGDPCSGITIAKFRF